MLAILRSAWNWVSFCLLKSVLCVKSETSHQKQQQRRFNASSKSRLASNKATTASLTHTDACWRCCCCRPQPPTEFIKWEREIFYPKRSIGNKKESLQLRNYLSRKNFVWSFNLSKKVPKTIITSILKKQYDWAFTPSKIQSVICVTCYLRKESDHF